MCEMRIIAQDALLSLTSGKPLEEQFDGDSGPLDFWLSPDNLWVRIDPIRPVHHCF